MKAERWNRIQEIFDAATELPRNERDAFVREASVGDEEIANDVLAMLRADDSAGEFIETAVRGATKEFAASGDPTQGLKRFGKYEILGWIGEGGFSQVHKGRDPMLQREVAIKTCTSASRDLRKRFYREAKIAAGLQHPNIVTVHDLGVENGVPFLVQEFLSGDDLASKLAKGGRISPSTCIDQLIQVARGLEYAHRKGVLHRDIKPSNVQALASGRVKILDFGIARFLEEDNPLTDQGMPIGTAGYQSPEQLEGLELDRRTDIFSFGVLAYEILTSSRPFPGRTFAEVYHRVLHSRPTPLRKAIRECPAALDSLVMSCLENDRERRPPNFTQIVARLEEIAATLPPATHPGAHVATIETPRRQPRVLIAIGAALLGTGLILGATLWSRGERTPSPAAERASAEEAAPVSVRRGSPGPIEAQRSGDQRSGEESSGGSVGRPLEAASTETQTSGGDLSPDRGSGEVASTAPPTETVDPSPNDGASRAGRIPGSEPATDEPPASTPPDAAEVARPRSSTTPPAETANDREREPRTLQIDRSIWEETAPPVAAGTAETEGVDSGLAAPSSSDPSSESEELPISGPEPLDRAEGALAAEPALDDAEAELTTDDAPPIPEDGTDLGEDQAPTIVPPELLEPLDPQYPSRRFRPSERAELRQLDRVRVVLLVLVDANGNVTRTSVRSSNDPGTSFEEAAIEAVETARWTPGTSAGEPVAAWKVIVVEYPIE